MRQRHLFIGLDEERPLGYLIDTLRPFRASAVVEAYRCDLESKMFNDLGRVMAWVTLPAAELPSLVQPGQPPALARV